MLIGKLKPDTFTCRNCLDMQIEYGQVENCKKCSVNKECQIISTGSSFWSGDYAVVLIDGKMKKVSMSRLYDIEEENK
jgi:hypothetical protein